MLTLISSIAERGKPPPVVVELRPDIYLLVEPSQRPRCQLSYLLIGTYGNILMGMPRQWHHFDKAFAGSGGLALVLPTELSDDTDRDLDLFRRFGPRWLVPESPAWAHIPASTPTCLSGLHVRGVDQFSDTYRWDVDFKTTRVLAGWRLPAADSSALLLHRDLPGNVEQVAMTVRNAQAAAAAASPRELAVRLQHLLASSGHVTWHLPGSTLLGCFDDIRFEQHDYDILTPRQRYQLGRAFSANGIEQLSSREWLWQNVPVQIPKAPRLLGVNSLDHVNLDRHHIWILTATQVAIYILRTASLSEQQREQLLLELVSRLPVNLEKIRPMVLDRFGDRAGILLCRNLRINQGETVAYFKRHRVKGLLGRPRPVQGGSS